MKWLFLFLLIQAHCGPKNNCAPQSTRCLGNESQICSTNKNWETFANCDQTNFASRCQSINEQNEDGHVTGHTCMRVDGGK